MKRNNLNLVLVILLCVLLNTLKAQQSTDASGGNASGSGGSASYSIGQTVYTTHTGTNGSVAQGVQQPYEISIVTEIKEAGGITLSFTIYPNPTANFLKLNVDNYSSENLNYFLYQLDSKIMETKKIENQETSIQMEHLASGIYFLKIAELDKELKIFKIVKN